MGDEHFHTAFCVLLFCFWSQLIGARFASGREMRAQRAAGKKFIFCCVFLVSFYGAELAPRRAWPRNALRTHIFNFTFTFTMLSSVCLYLCLCVCVFFGVFSVFDFYWNALCGVVVVAVAVVVASTALCGCLKQLTGPTDRLMNVYAAFCLPLYTPLPRTPSPSLSVCLSACMSVCLAVWPLCCFSPRTIYICSLSILMKIFWKCAIFLLRHTIYGRTGQKHAKKIAECSWKWHEWRSCSLACLVPENRWQFEINLVQSDWDLWLPASN